MYSRRQRGLDFRPLTANITITLTAQFISITTTDNNYHEHAQQQDCHQTQCTVDKVVYDECGPQTFNYYPKVKPRSNCFVLSYNTSVLYQCLSKYIVLECFEDFFLFSLWRARGSPSILQNNGDTLLFIISFPKNK